MDSPDKFQIFIYIVLLFFVGYYFFFYLRKIYWNYKYQVRNSKFYLDRFTLIQNHPEFSSYLGDISQMCIDKILPLMEITQKKIWDEKQKEEVCFAHAFSALFFEKINGASLDYLLARYLNSEIMDFLCMHNLLEKYPEEMYLSLFEKIYKGDDNILLVEMTTIIHFLSSPLNKMC